MKLISAIEELKKGDSIIIKDDQKFCSLGYTKVFGEVFKIESGKSYFSIKCEQTKSIEEVKIENGKIFLMN